MTPRTLAHDPIRQKQAADQVREAAERFNTALIGAQQADLLVEVYVRARRHVIVRPNTRMQGLPPILLVKTMGSL